MVFHPEQYEVFPAVYKIGEPTEIHILPMQAQYVFEDDKEYSVKIFGMMNDMIVYHGAKIDTFTVNGKEGMLSFTHTFASEMEYAIEILSDGKKLVQLQVYAVAEDLYNKVPMRGDLHVHSYRSDGSVEPAMVAAYYRESGFDFISLTDHNRYYSSKEMMEAFADVKLGMTLINGEEVHTPGTNLHIVHVGGKESVDVRYIHTPEEFEKEVDALEAELSYVPEQYRHRMALAQWSVNNIHRAGGLAIFPHPYWRSKAYNVNSEFTNLLFESGWFDAFEVFGGDFRSGGNLQQLVWHNLQTAGIDIPVVGSSDSHLFAGAFDCHYTIVFSDSTDAEDIMQAVRDGYCVAAKAESGDQTNVVCCGELRFATFAQFLIARFFNPRRKMLEAEGILMRGYLQERVSGAALSALAGSAKEYYEAFYGKNKKTLSKKRESFMKKWLQVQRDSGIATRGSGLEVRPDRGNLAHL